MEPHQAMVSYRAKGSDERVQAVRFTRRDPPDIAIDLGTVGGLKHYGVAGKNTWLFPEDGDWIVRDGGGLKIVGPAEFAAAYERG